MARPASRCARKPDRRPVWWLMAVGLAAVAPGPGRAETPAEIRYYSTAAPPRELSGPLPTLLALGDTAPAAPPAEEPARIATAPAAVETGRVPAIKPKPAAPAPAPTAADPIAEAKRLIAQCRERYEKVQDYTCTLYKRERVNGKLTSQHIMALKARTQPSSVYIRFRQPNAGREAIYVHGQNKGKALVHDVGLGKLLAGTVALDPLSGRAMEDCRHPITEAGLGHLIDTVATAWDKELHASHSVVTIKHNAKVGDRPCTLIVSDHPEKQAGFLFHSVKVFIDHELGLPIRFEAYDWPRRPGVAPELVEEYTYSKLKLDVGLRDADFDPNNKAYSFGRF